MAQPSLGQDACFLQPYGVAIDADGDVIVTDTDHNLIRIIAASGRLSALTPIPSKSPLDVASAVAPLTETPAERVARSLGKRTARDNCTFTDSISC